jgi:V/A-type H+-transporting ATPase subunit D
MERLPLSVNKSNLLRLKEELFFASEGLDLLDEKKEALVARISTLSTKAELVRAQVNQQLAAGYAEFRTALLAHGWLPCERASLAVSLGEDVQIKERTFMGIPLAQVTINFPRLLPSYGFQGTGAAMDALAGKIRDSLEAIGELAEIEVALFRLVTEMKKTLRRMNALQNIHIPQYLATIKHIEENLEEKEREALFHLKRQKDRQREAKHGTF